MSFVKINTHNLIDRFQVRTQQEQFKFHQLDSGFNDYSLSIWIQSERDELNYQIARLLDEVREWIGYYPRPIWKTIKVPLDQYYFYSDKILTLPDSAWLLELGVRKATEIEGGASFVKNPVSGQAQEAVFTITTTEVTEGEVALFHIAADAFQNTADDRFRILPSSIFYNGTAYIIKVPYARLIKPVLWETEFVLGDPSDRKEYNPITDANFVSTVDIYNITNDSTITGKLQGFPFDYSGLSAIQEADVDIVVMDSEDGTFKIIANDTIEPNFYWTHVLVNAHVGHPLTSEGLMNPIIEEMIIRKARVEMGINSRLAAAKISTQWDFDELPAWTKPDANSGRTGIGFTPNPIGARNIDIEMFKRFLPIANWRGKVSDSRFWIR